MRTLRIAYYISGHGFGHATRSLTIIEAIAAAAPDTRITIRSSVPASFLRSSTRTAVSIDNVDADTGMTQIDSLRLDVGATAERARDFYRTFDARADAEAGALRTMGATLVIGDIPPLAFAAAARAGIPSVAIANFTWDWIYEAYPEFAAEAPDVVPAIRDAYAQATLTLRLPFAGGFDAMQGMVRDIPLVARRARLGRKATRELLGLRGDRPIVLASFGGHGAAMPYERIAAEDQLTLIVTEREAPAPRSAPRIRRVSVTEMVRLGVRYEDLVGAADVVVSKPGYGIVSECIANGTPLLFTSRGQFPEQQVLIDGMAQVLPCLEISNDDLRAGSWANHVMRLLAQPFPARSPGTDGAALAADAVLKLNRYR